MGHVQKQKLDISKNESSEGMELLAVIACRNVGQNI